MNCHCHVALQTCRCIYMIKMCFLKLCCWFVDLCKMRLISPYLQGIIRKLHPIIVRFRVIWNLSAYFNNSERMTLLLRQVSNGIIHACTQRINITHAIHHSPRNVAIHLQVRNVRVAWLSTLDPILFLNTLISKGINCSHLFKYCKRQSTEGWRKRQSTRG